MAGGRLLEDLTWAEAEALLTAETTVVIPLGAAAKEHGLHLRLNNDLVLVDFLKSAVAERVDCLIAPTVNYFFYPSFVEYPGSITLSETTARDIIVQICRSLHSFGPRRFYVINTGISTLKALAPAKEILHTGGVELRYSNLDTLLSATAHLCEQEGGSHADEVETSMMLYITPERVDMSKAKQDYHPGKGPLARTEQPGRTFSASGVFGDPTLASAEKGQTIVKSLVSGIVAEIEELRKASIPARRD